MAINKAKTMLFWGKIRVGCKRSAPNRENAPHVKKTKTKMEMENLSSSLQKKEEEIIPDWEEPEKEVTTDNTLSVSAQENWSKDVQYDTSETHFSANGTEFSAEGDDSYLQDSCHRYNTNWTQFSAEGDDSYLQDSWPQYNTAERSPKNEEGFNAESMLNKWACSVCKAAAVSSAVFPCCHICPCWNCEFENDCCPVCGVPRTDGVEFCTKGGDAYLSNTRPQYNTRETYLAEGGNFVYVDHLESRSHGNTNGTHFSVSAKEVNPYLPDSHSQCNTNGFHFSAEGGDSNLPDLHPHSQNKTTEGSTKNEVSTEAQSQVDRWVCRVCKESEVSIVVLPCSHLCLCWACHLETYNCPICGEDMTSAFYVRSE